MPCARPGIDVHRHLARAGLSGGQRRQEPAHDTVRPTCRRSSPRRTLVPAGIGNVSTGSAEVTAAHLAERERVDEVRAGSDRVDGLVERELERRRGATGRRSRASRGGSCRSRRRAARRPRRESGSDVPLGGAAMPRGRRHGDALARGERRQIPLHALDRVAVGVQRSRGETVSASRQVVLVECGRVLALAELRASDRSSRRRRWSP